MSEAANIQENVTDCIYQIFSYVKSLSTHLKHVEIGKQNMGRDLIQDIIVVGYCTIHFSHMSARNLEEIIESTLEYFKTGLYDTNLVIGSAHVINSSFIVRAWVYTPDTHNDAGEWFQIFAFNDKHDADGCVIMLKEIETELKKLY